MPTSNSLFEPAFGLYDYQFYDEDNWHYHSGLAATAVEELPAYRVYRPTAPPPRPLPVPSLVPPVHQRPRHTMNRENQPRLSAPKFNGEPKSLVTVKHFIRCVENCREYSGNADKWTSKQTAAFAQQLLEGAAGIWISQLVEAQDPRIKVWEAVATVPPTPKQCFRELLLERWYQVQSPAQKMKLRLSTKQGPSEPVRDFADKVILAVQNVWSDDEFPSPYADADIPVPPPPAAQGDDAAAHKVEYDRLLPLIKQLIKTEYLRCKSAVFNQQETNFFLDGLQDRIRTECMLLNPKSFSECLEFAIRVEETLRDRQNPAPTHAINVVSETPAAQPSQPPLPPPAAHSSDTALTRQLLSMVVSQQQQQRNPGFSTQSTRGRRFTARGRGTTRGRPTNREIYPATAPPGTRCSYCGHSGQRAHYAKECRKQLADKKRGVYNPAGRQQPQRSVGTVSAPSGHSYAVPQPLPPPPQPDLSAFSALNNYVI